MRILIAGSVAYDRILNFDGLFAEHILPDKIHNLNISFYTPVMNESFGGCAGNIGYSLALLGDQPTLAGRVGRDFGRYGEWLSTRGVDISKLEIDESEVTAMGMIITDSKDNQITAFHPGAMSKPASIDPAGYDAVIVAPTNPTTMQTLPTAARTAGVPVVFDPGQQIPALSKDDLIAGMTGAKVVISNDYELSLITEKTGWSEAEILKHAEILVTTLGDKGSVIRTGTTVIEAPVAPVAHAIDPTGAGDAYRSGFVYALLRGWPLEVCGRLGAVVAAYTVETQGTQTHTFTNQDIRVRYRDTFNQELPHE